MDPRQAGAAIGFVTSSMDQIKMQHLTDGSIKTMLKQH
jgi:hypothetical protein